MQAIFWYNYQIMEPKKEKKVLIKAIKIFTFGYIIFAMTSSILVFRQMLKPLEGINIFSFPLLIFTAVILSIIFGLLYFFFYLALNKAKKGKNIQSIIYLVIGIGISIVLTLYKK